jgi:hypothetical protein
MRSGAKILITTVFSSKESVNDNQFTLLVSAVITVFWVCWSQITFTGSGLEHMMSMMSYSRGYEPNPGGINFSDRYGPKLQLIYADCFKCQNYLNESQ